MKLFIASVVILFGVVFFLFSLFPADMSVSRVALINASGDSVFRKIADLNTWPSWNTLLAGADSLHRPVAVHSGTDQLSSGNLTVSWLKKSSDSLVTRWQAGSGRSFIARYTITPSANGVLLQFTLQFHLHWYPWEKMASMFYDKQLGPLLEQSLRNLQKELDRP